MDPNSCLEQALQSLRDLGDCADDEDAREAAIESLENLSQWLRDGGFPPDVKEVLDSQADLIA